MVSFTTKDGKRVSFKTKSEGAKPKKKKYRKLKGGKKSGGKKVAKRGYKKKRSNGGSRGQGVVSWLINGTALVMAMANPVSRMIEATKQSENKLNYFVSRMGMDYTGIKLRSDTLEYDSFDAKRMARGWGTMAGAVAFKKGAGYATKSIKVKSLIPRLRA